MNSKYFAKKRIMFIQKEDYNYLIYNLILLLDNLECFNQDKMFSDFRKIAYLVDFISSSKSIEYYSKDEIGQIYSKAQIKKKLLSHVLIVLKNKEYLGINLNRKHQTFDIWLKKENIPSDFFDDEIFRNEIGKINELKQVYNRLRTTTVKTLLEKFYNKKGVLTWEI